jgi:hypothetical protein
MARENLSVDNETYERDLSNGDIYDSHNHIVGNIKVNPFSGQGDGNLLGRQAKIKGECVYFDGSNEFTGRDGTRER